jgi:hypothetical protein
MADYEQMFEEAKKSGNLRHMRPQQIKLKEGDVIVGKFLGREAIKSKDTKMSDYYMYTFERTDQTVRFAVSGHYDTHDGAQLKVDGVYALEYRGKLDLDKGKTFKDVDTIIITEPKDETEDEEEDEEGEKE